MDWWASAKGLRIIYATSTAISIMTGHMILGLILV
jgi:hypothetical protein